VLFVLLLVLFVLLLVLFVLVLVRVMKAFFETPPIQRNRTFPGTKMAEKG
jgi:hypothetical protein